MPASGKMLKNAKYKANIEAGIGDASGRMPSKVVRECVMASCTICMTAIRMTSTNIEAKTHYEMRHGDKTYAICFPGQFDPTLVVPVTSSISSSSTTSADAASKDFDLIRARARDAKTIAEGGVPKGVKKKPVQDLSFLDASLKVKK